MNEKVLHTLEYNKILDQLTEYAFSADAKIALSGSRARSPTARRSEQLRQDIGCLKPAVQIRLPVAFWSYGHPRFAKALRDRRRLKRHPTAARLPLLESAKRAKAFARSQDDNDQPDDS